MDRKLKNLLKIAPESSKSNRLQSLRGPRDLSLGGTKPKKTFAPNVNVIRNKDKAKDVKKIIEQKKKERFRNEYKPRNSSDNSRFVQSYGIFSEGSGEMRKSSGYGERLFHVKSENDVAAPISMPSYKKSELKVDKTKEDVVLDELLNQSDEFEDDKMQLKPVLLDNKVVDHAIKTENNINGYDLQLKTFFTKMENEGYDNLKFALFKLPDTLADRGLSDDPNEKKIFDYTLKTMLEGKVGTIQIRRSGKMYIKIGCVNYLLNSNQFSSLSGTVASYASPTDEQQKGKFGVLGNIEDSFILQPAWKDLLKQS